MQIADWYMSVIIPLIFIKTKKIPNKGIKKNETQAFSAVCTHFLLAFSEINNDVPIVRKIYQILNNNYRGVLF
jgi:hypothetical protein